MTSEHQTPTSFIGKNIMEEWKSYHINLVGGNRGVDSEILWVLTTRIKTGKNEIEQKIIFLLEILLSSIYIYL